MAFTKPNFSIKKYINDNHSTLVYVRDFVIIEGIYGFLLAITLSTLLPSHFKFNLRYIIALGIAFYFIKEELPKIIFKKAEAR